MSVPHNFVSEWFGIGKKTLSQQPMNILLTDTNPQTNARNLDNNRVATQIVDVALLLSMLANRWTYPINELWRQGEKESSFIHWCEDQDAHVDWLCEYGICLLVEYANRFGKKHAGSFAIYDFLEAFGNPMGLPPSTFLNMAVDNVQGFDFRWRGPVTQAYRDLLCTLWDTAKTKPSWGGRTPPHWYVERLIRSDDIIAESA